MSYLRTLASLLSVSERRQVVALTIGLIVMALFEVAGVASILPFLALVADPESFRQSPPLYWAYRQLGLGSANTFLIFVGAAVLLVLAFGNAFSAFVMSRLYTFTWLQNHRLSLRLLRSYLDKPYPFFLANNTADMGKNVLSEVQEVVSGVLLPSLKLVAKVCVTLFVLAVLIAVDPVLALTTVLVLGCVYLALFALIRRSMSRLGEVRVTANADRYRLANEALSGVKEVRVLNREKHFIDRFAVHSESYARKTAVKRLVGELPRYALELVTFGGILLIVLYLLGTGRDLDQLLPLIGLYAFATYRLVPAMQQIFQASTDISSSLASLEVLRRDLTRVAPVEAAPPLPFSRTVALRHATFAYAGTDHPVFTDLSLTVHRGESVALVGSTGSGKTTLLDVLLGLLSLSEGALEVDGVPLTGALWTRWRGTLGYVPQKIYLADDSVRANIAFGIGESAIDRAAVERAARQAQIYDFIVQELPNGFDTLVGERGVRLSGGQQQRLGIARALYSNPPVLVLDEATSALDGFTEAKIMRNLKQDDPDRTLLIVTHRLSTVRDCDTIFFLQDGRIVARGGYEALLELPRFRSMAQADLDGVA